MARARTAPLSVLLLALAAGTAHAQDQAPAPAAPPPAAPAQPGGGPFLFTDPNVDTVNGAIGVCVRWRDEDHSHVSDVVIVEPSGDAKVDAEAPGMIRSIPMPTPFGYEGEWEGLGLSFTGAPPRPEPDCATLMKTYDPVAGSI